MHMYMYLHVLYMYMHVCAHNYIINVLYKTLLSSPSPHSNTERSLSPSSAVRLFN